MNFCTLFNSSFLFRGIALYQSLERTCNDFRLYVYCMDREVSEYLSKLGFHKMIIIPLVDFEGNDLLSVKSSRSTGEYCWTATPYIIRHCLKKFNPPDITYLDADLYFYKTPEILMEEWKESKKSILLTEHNYSPRYDQTKTSGRFCVQFMGFKNNSISKKALDWWAEKCLDWCYAKTEEGRFGDQKYVEQFPSLFQSCHTLQNIGGGVAPWNIENYNVEEGPQVDKQNLIFYHFHTFKIFMNKKFELVDLLYRLDQSSISYIYENYIQEILEAQRRCSQALDGKSLQKLYDTEKNGCLKKLKKVIKNRNYVVQK